MAFFCIRSSYLRRIHHDYQSRNFQRGGEFTSNEWGKFLGAVAGQVPYRNQSGVNRLNPPDGWQHCIGFIFLGGSYGANPIANVYLTPEESGLGLLGGSGNPYPSLEFESYGISIDSYGIHGGSNSYQAGIFFFFA